MKWRKNTLWDWLLLDTFEDLGAQDTVYWNWLTDWAITFITLWAEVMAESLGNCF